MTTIAADGMARLLDLVAQSLDQPDAAGADLAASAFLSASTSTGWSPPRSVSRPAPSGAGCCWSGRRTGC